MRKILILGILATFMACTEAPREVSQYSIEQFMDNLSVFGGSFSPDESKLLITSNETGIFNVYATMADGSGKTQLTFSESEAMYAVAYFPEDERFLYSADQGGNEINHLYMQDTDGKVTDLTPWEGAVSNFAGWSRDFTKLYITSNKRDRRFFDFYEMDLVNFEPKLLYENKENMNPSAISITGKYLALSKAISSSNNDLYLLNLENDEMIHISEHEGDATFYPADFSLNDEYLYYLSNEGSEFTYLSSYHIESGEKKVEFEADWDVSYAYFSFNQKYQVIGINQDAKTVVRLTETATGEEVKLPAVEGGDISRAGISRSEKIIRLAISSPVSPGDLYTHVIGESELTRLTRTLNPEIDEADLVAAEVIRYPSYDGLEIPAILYKPHQATSRNKVPALLLIHGGPGGQSRVGFSSTVQYLVNHGYAILAVNNRGSSGYGKTFFQLDNQRHGEDDLMDCVKAKDYLATLGYIDMDRVGIMGGSYGGYMTMAALTFHPEEFAVGVNIFGVTNWLRTLRSIPPWWEAFKKQLYDEMGNPETEDSIRLYKISPLFHAENVTKPLMVLQGANDPRVLQVESDEIVEAVKKNGVPVEYVIFDDEGHGFRKKENTIKGYGQVKVFLDTYLKGETEAEE